MHSPPPHVASLSWEVAEAELLLRLLKTIQGRGFQWLWVHFLVPGHLWQLDSLWSKSLKSEVDKNSSVTHQDRYKPQDNLFSNGFSLKFWFGIGFLTTNSCRQFSQRMKTSLRQNMNFIPYENTTMSCLQDVHGAATTQALAQVLFGEDDRIWQKGQWMWMLWGYKLCTPAPQPPRRSSPISNICLLRLTLILKCFKLGNKPSLPMPHYCSSGWPSWQWCTAPP